MLPIIFPVEVILTSPDEIILPATSPSIIVFLAFIFALTFPSFPITSSFLDIISPTTVPSILMGRGE
ncbi:hypothetical protein ES708_01711 [subsurface metagenome]